MEHASSHATAQSFKQTQLRTSSKISADAGQSGPGSPVSAALHVLQAPPPVVTEVLPVGNAPPTPVLEAVVAVVLPAPEPVEPVVPLAAPV
jgi:hypothetical protein